jgi:hypothetical protein
MVSESRSVVEWQSADERNSRERIDRARRAAEDLFKPPHREAETASPALPPKDTNSTERPARRQPRIFALPPRAPAATQTEAPSKPQPARRKATAKPETNVVPPSQTGRVRTLTRYGMTPAQVAELYEVTVGEIERIIKTPAHPSKSR